MTRQLAFDLPHRAALGREDFFVSGANAAALAALDGWRGWPGGKMVLAGPPGSGKTHLAQVWAAEAGATAVTARHLPADLPALARGPLVVEDCHRIAQNGAAQTALFHLHNLMAAARHPLLLTGTVPVRGWGLTLPDLASRVAAAGVALLDEPDDALLSAVLVKLFADRQMVVAPPVVAFLVTRMERSLASAGALVAALDAEAFARGAAVTRPLAAAVLDAGPPSPDRHTAVPGSRP